MPENPPANMPRITAYLYYEDVAGALSWLVRAFGFRERMRLTGPDGRIQHAEMELHDGVIMMGRPGPDYRNPKRLGQATQGLYVYVDDVDAHFEQAKAAGATMLSPVEGTGDGKRYRAEDLEGHRWMFMQRQ